MNFKLKVYLPARKEGKLFDGHPFLSTFTCWTFALSESRKAHRRPRRDDPEGGVYHTYHNAHYVDGSAWALSEIDGCVLSDDVRLTGDYQVFRREMRSLPVYDTSQARALTKRPAANHYSAEEVAELFPLALIWHGAIIDGREFRLSPKTGALNEVALKTGRVTLETMLNKAGQQEVEELFVM